MDCKDRGSVPESSSERLLFAVTVRSRVGSSVLVKDARNVLEVVTHTNGDGDTYEGDGNTNGDGDTHKGRW
jgi:hypothetical protein